MSTDRERELAWQVEVYLPHQLRTTTHARRLASLRRQLEAARAELKLVRMARTLGPSTDAGDLAALLESTGWEVAP